ncbi:hypothetical protein ACQCSX_08700 [Pseudarthrobacter sp. P1]|uniref:hypothetical protein n=1 Tax=Pseudarthrobacter sp. P1 TaxID=3418418 RepID=UPI003CF80C48
MSRTDEQLAELVCRDSDAHAIYQMGYLRGHLDGQAFMTLNNEAAAELAARRFLALDALDIEIRRQMKSTIEFVDVLAARRRSDRTVAANA